MMQHNILHITGDAMGGIRKHAHAILFDLLNRGVSVFLVRSEKCDSLGAEETAILNNRGCNVHILSIKKKPALGDILNIIRIARICKEKNISLIHGHGAKGGLYSRCVGFLCRLPVVYTPHGGSVHKNFGRIEGLLYVFVERALKPFTTQFLFESKYTCAAYEELCGSLSTSKYSINYNGVDCKHDDDSKMEWDSGLDECINLLIVGMLRPEKGQSLALQILHVIRRSGKNANLHFCGDGPDRAALEALAHRLNLSSNVFFHGDVSDVCHYYKRSSIVLIPSLFESFGYVAVEAGLMRRPVIASNVGGLREIIDDGVTGLLVESGCSDAFVSAIESIIANPLKTTQMVDSAQERCLDLFSSSRMLSGVFRVYQSVLGFD
jgi:glycosyltransferase involved in cell wall biosynthesis